MSSTMSPERFQDRFEAYANEPQQVSGVWLLHRAITDLPGSEAVLCEKAPWALKFSEKPPSPPPGKNALAVPYFSQNDNASGSGYRECFSSSCAMLAAFWGKVSGDDEYNAIRSGYGDSTDAQAQLSALRSLGLEADFFTNGSPASLEREINAGRPVATGWLHKGPSSNPSGGGHWSVVIGYDSAAWIHNDPNGEANLAAGGYTNNLQGTGMRYSRSNWNPRWMPAGTGGWLLTAKG
ncbi:C39 family peptidase [Synechococcus sp. EJ6-Ellesmere]|uniref:C39 family peptidase n=1 Tax=Synechococcus sp. EJ6-Ellesmere TaxID=2823734 RepID=UPI0020CDF50B|nr:C39 family peptidase [Synechococcus sp. EJ6-Ellesmere]MCP9826015.1 C39 family peptidase [Synechococcus sp. EJ6-Ellesmere]